MEKLYEHQKIALNKMKNGCILNGGVGTGKSRTALAYYYTRECGGRIDGDKLTRMSHPKDLYIITTAKKRDDGDWDKEMQPFELSSIESNNTYKNHVVIDSWNNAHKYISVVNAFFIFDEQRAVGSGQWAKSFIKIARSNHWILLTATPGDTWMDYCPVFIANGFYKNRTEFIKRHVVYNRFVTYPKVDKYIDVGRLVRLKELITVDMEYKKRTTAHHEWVTVTFDKKNYDFVLANRWDPYKNEPVQQMSSLCYILRRVINTDPGRLNACKKLINDHPRSIIFYNFDYELEELRELCKEMKVKCTEWNGHKHEEVPKDGQWVYLVQYSAGSEGWNCITTNTIIFFSQSYSYKQTTQAAGRIDRLNTPYNDLYYYHLISNASIDKSIKRCLNNKRDFNERDFVRYA